MTKSENIVQQNYKITRAEREKLNHQKGKVFWFSGLSGSGKSSLANLLEVELHQKGFKTYVLDGDNIRFGLNKDLGFSAEDRKENLRRIGEVAKLFVDAGVIVLAAFITPYEAERESLRQIVGENDFVHIFVDCPVEVCAQRDVKGLYEKAKKGEIKNFTGVSAPFEIPAQNDLIIKTDTETPAESLKKLVHLAFEKIQ
ncbi:adenylyl-sulfate kinase [Ornithobacterium rhinotracheale]|uniref:adenylyl-sulfate kinase n=1 Tax=Ornithobacterium rhinotracheale TaxID=28251 RepID=UPI0038737667